MNVFLFALSSMPAQEDIANAVKNTSALNPIEIITLIGIFLTMLVGLINIFIAIHRSKVDGITKNRADWIGKVRDTASKILQYDSQLYADEDSLNIANAELLKNAYNLSLLLNVVGSFDATIMRYLCNFLSARR